MKKSISFCLILFTLIFCFSFACDAASNIKVLVNNQEIIFDVQPQIINDRTMVPLRAIFESLGASVDWDDSTKTIISCKNDIEIVSIIGDCAMYVNGKRKIMDVSPMIIDSRTLVPARFIAEAFGCSVEWSESENSVYIYDNSEEQNIESPKYFKDDIVGIYEAVDQTEGYSIIVYDYNDSYISFYVEALQIEQGDILNIVAMHGTAVLKNNEAVFSYVDSNENKGTGKIVINSFENIELSLSDNTINPDSNWSISNASKKYVRVLEDILDFNPSDTTITEGKIE